MDGAPGFRCAVSSWMRRSCYGFAVADALVAAGDDFAHGGEVVDAEDGHDFELAIGGLVHLAVFPDDQGGDGFGALDVGDVEALDAAGQLGEHEGVGEGFLNGFARGLEDAEALRVGLLGVLAGEVDEGTFFSALGDGDFDAVAGALGEQRGEGFAVVEVDGDEDGARNVVLVDVELLEEGGEDGAGVEGRRLRLKPHRALESSDLRLADPVCVSAPEGSGTRASGSSDLRSIPDRRCFEQVGEIFPEEFAAVDDFAGAHVEEIDGEAAVFEVIAEDVGVVALLGGGDALLFLRADGRWRAGRAGGRRLRTALLRRRPSCAW